MPKPTILLDMDEVICDFTGGACDVMGVHRGDLELARKSNEWSIEPAFSRILNRSVTSREMWSAINLYGDHFWAELLPLPWMKDVVNLVSRYSDNWHIVTSPSLSASSYNGKVRWLKRMFGARFDRFVITPHKELFAKAGILIDDRPENIRKFQAMGGQAILFPAFGNSLRQYAMNPVPKLETLLKESI